MVQSCTDVSARMMELLYGELPEEVRADVEAHIAGCSRCAAEREGFEQTRAVARAVLDDPPPARARAAILQAAAAHAAGVQARRPQAAAAAAPAIRAAVPPSKQPERRSIGDWIRSRWALPTLATVGAVAMFVLGSRLFLDPQRTYERGKQVLAPEAANAPEAPANAVAKPRGEADPRTGAAPPPRIAEPKPDTDTGDVNRSLALGAHRRGPGKGSAGGRANAPISAPARGPAKGSFDDLALEGLASGGGRAAGGKAKAPSVQDDPLSGSSDLLKRKFAPPPPPKAEAEAEADKESAAGAPGRVVARSRAVDRAEAAAPEAPLEGGYEMREKALAPREESARQARRDEAVVAEAKPAAAPAPAPPPAASPVASAAQPAPRPTAAKRPTVKTQVAPEDGSGVSAYGGGGPAATAKKSAKTTAAKDVTALALRADRLFAEGRWSEAAAAYRDLLRLDPDNTAVGRWQQRLAVSRTQNEATAATPPQAAPPAKAAKKAAKTVVGH